MSQAKGVICDKYGECVHLSLESKYAYLQKSEYTDKPSGITDVDILRGDWVVLAPEIMIRW